MGQRISAPEFHSFAFITDELLLVAFVDRDQVSLRVLAATSEGSVLAAEDIQYLCDLRFPILQANVEDVLITSDPSPTRTNSYIPVAPFTCSATDVLFTITLKYSMEDPTGMDLEWAVVLLVPRSTILDRVSSSFGSSLEWESWGPQGSRMLDIKPSDVWVCHSYGMKFIHNPVGEAIAIVYDFNPYATRKDVDTPNRHLPWKVMERETRISCERSPFKTDVVTSLPGREVSLELTPNDHGLEAVMITEDHIVIVQVSESTAHNISINNSMPSQRARENMPTWQCNDKARAELRVDVLMQDV